MTRKILTWILVADGGKARLFCSDVRLPRIRPVIDDAFVSEARHLSNQDILSDRPGRAFDRSRGQPHAMEPPSDPKTVEEDRFVRYLADYLKQALDRGAFDALVLVAAPRALGILRRAMDKTVQATVESEI
ncbi:MAG: host attachment protein, partial [Alphaproteobacteria bacterium]